MSAGATLEVVRATSAGALAELAATRFAALAQAVAARGRFAVALAGGQTPRAMYERLAARPDAVPWARTSLFFGDERCVAPDDERSNFRMAADALLRHVAVAPSAVHRIAGEGPPDEAASAYDRELRAAFPPMAGGPAGGASPTFDVALLGVGPDGHTASLFPGDPALAERDRWAVAVPAPGAVEPHVPRVTVTLPVLCRSREVWFLCAGAGKREVVTAILSGAPRARDWPASMVRGIERTVWLVDADALPAGGPGIA